MTKRTDAEIRSLLAGLQGLGEEFYTYDDVAYMGPGKRRRCRACDWPVMEFKLSDQKWHKYRHAAGCPVGEALR